MNAYQVLANISCPGCGRPLLFEGLCDECESKGFEFNSEEEEEEEENISLTDEHCGKAVKIDLEKSGLIKCECGRVIGKIKKDRALVLLDGVSIKAKKIGKLSIVGSLFGIGD